MTTKQITIIQENASPLVIDDRDDRPLKEYTDEMSKLLENNNVTIIHTSSCSVITRPSKVTSIIVREFPSSDDDRKEEQQMEKSQTVEEESPDGIISD